MEFDKSKLETQFSNMMRVEGKAYPDHYSIVNAHGSTIAQVVFSGGGEMNIEVDNFPGQKQYYSSSIPHRSLSEFVGDMSRVGIELKPIIARSPTVSRNPVTRALSHVHKSEVKVAASNIGTGKEDVFYPEAVKAVLAEQKASASFIQRVLRVGYNRAAYLLEAMEIDGIVSVENNRGVRTVLKGSDGL